MDWMDAVRGLGGRICQNNQLFRLFWSKWGWQGLQVLVACSVSLLVAARTVQLRCHGRTLLATADLRPHLGSTNLGLNRSRPIEGPSIVSWDVLFVGKSDFPILRSSKEVPFKRSIKLRGKCIIAASIEVVQRAEARGGAIYRADTAAM